MLGRLLLLFITVPLLEALLLSVLSEWIGWPATLLMIIGTGVLGAWLARQQGWQVVRRLRADAADGRLPAIPLLEGLLIFVAGALLITPGLLTDVAGVLLLIPYTRRKCQDWLLRWFRARFQVGVLRGGGQPRGPDGGQIIDSYVVDDRSEDRKLDGP